VKNEGPGNDAYGYERYGFSGKIDADVTDAITLKLSGDYRHADSSFGQAINVVPSTLDGLPLLPGGGVLLPQSATLGFVPQRGVVRSNTDSANYDRSKGYSITGEVDWALSDTLKLTAISGYRDFKDDNQSDVDNTPAGFDAGVGFQPNPNHYPVMYVGISGPRQPQHVSYFSQEVRLNYTGDRLNVVGGAFFQTLKDRGSGITPFIFDGAYVLQNPALAGTYFYNATVPIYHINDNTYAAFADATYKVTNTISLFGGLRYTHEKIDLTYSANSYFFPVAANYGAIILPGPNGQPSISVATGAVNATPISVVDFATSKTTNNLSGRAGIQWQPTSATNFYFSYNRGYKGPAADVSRGAAAPDPATGYSPLLKPEIASSFELGAKMHLLDNNVQLSVNLFDETVSNLQQAIVLPSTVTQLINAGDVKTKGVEFEGRARIMEGLTLDVAATYDDPKYSGDILVGCYPGQTAAQGCNAGRQNLDGAQSVNSYKWRYDVGGTYTTPIGDTPLDLTLHVGYDWFSSSPQRVDTDPLLREPSHGLLDASVTLARHTGKWALQVFGKNLTNDFYYGSLVNVDNTISRVSGYLNRDYKRYIGLKFTVGF
jgi:iron complex outermembrane receptor protein